MNKMSTSACEVTQYLRLPLLDGKHPGPLHTITCDRAGNIYASIEFDHTIFSLDPSGSLRWHITGRGDSPAMFHYPKGLAVGWIAIDGRRRECVAVADSWNRRVQFLDLQGTPLKLWTEANGTAFVEVGDVRFMPEGISATGPVWLVLDKGNHCLYAIGPDGGLVFAIGRGFPPSLESNWSVPGAFFAAGDQAVRYMEKYCPALDFLWYPERVLGNSSDAMFVYEPLRQRLKQLRFPHMLPITFSPALEIEWVSAESLALLAFDQAQEQLIRYNLASNSLDLVSIDGQLVYSEDSPCKFWVQNNDEIKRYKWLPHESEGRGDTAVHLLLRSAQNEQAVMDAASVHEAVDLCLAVVREELECAETILNSNPRSATGVSSSEIPNTIAAFRRKLASANSRLHRAFHTWSVGDLEFLVANGSKGLTGDVLENAALKKYVCDEVSTILARIRQAMEKCASMKNKFPALAGTAQMVLDDLDNHPWLDDVLVGFGEHIIDQHIHNAAGSRVMFVWFAENVAFKTGREI